MTHQQIRERDRFKYGVIPEGYTMHHLWYSEEYDPSSFIIITPEEHAKIHGRNIMPSSSGVNRKEKNKAYHKKYYEEHKEEIKEKQKENQRKYRESHREYFRNYSKEYYEKRKEI